MTLLLDVAVDIPRLPHDFMYLFCCHSCPVSCHGGVPLWAPGEPSGGWGPLGSPVWLGQAAPSVPNRLFCPETRWQPSHPPSSFLGQRGRGCGAQERPGASADGGAAGGGLGPSSPCCCGSTAHCCSPWSPPCTLAPGSPGRTRGTWGRRRTAGSRAASFSSSSSFSSFSSHRCRLSPGAWVSALTSADQLTRGLSITCQNLYSFDICRYVPLFPTFHQQKGLSNSFQIRRPGGDTQHLWTLSPVRGRRRAGPWDCSQMRSGRRAPHSRDPQEPL